MVFGSAYTMSISPLPQIQFTPHSSVLLMRPAALPKTSEGNVLLHRSKFVPSLLPWLLIAFVAIALCVIGLIRFRTPKALPPGDFTREFAIRLRAALPGWTVDIKAEKELRIINAKGKESTAFLGNAYAAYVRNPKALPDLIQQYGKGFVASQWDETPIDRSWIVPIVKDRKWLAKIRDSLKARGAKEPPGDFFDYF